MFTKRIQAVYILIKGNFLYKKKNTKTYPIQIEKMTKFK